MMENKKGNGEEIPVNYIEESEKEDTSTVKSSPEKESKKKTKGTTTAEKEQINYKEKYLDLQNKYDVLNDQFLRLRAEFVNYKKRIERENIEYANYLKAEIMKALLPILDDFQHMIEKSGEGTNEQSVFEGAKLIYEKLYQTLVSLGLEKIEALGQEFDPQVHEAMMLQNTDNQANHNKIIGVLQEGYKFKDRLIRPSKAIVGNFVEEPQPPEKKN
ncbi:MAG: nucleotide exchange factor GrpE [Calditrichia bacterium]